METGKITFNLHFQETFFVSFPVFYSPKSKIPKLSISIFRRLSLFPNWIYRNRMQIKRLSISIFRRLSLFRRMRRIHDSQRRKNFQSPFSGDFLCFMQGHSRGLRKREDLSISIFRRLSLFLEVFVEGNEIIDVLSISIFRRLSLFRG